MRRIVVALVVILTLGGCASGAPTGPISPETTAQGGAVQTFTATEHGEFTEGGAMAFLPCTDHLLISERVRAEAA